jgi:hypothetical protein
MRQRIQQAVASGDTATIREMRQNLQQSGDSTVARFREGGAPQQGGNQQQPRVRQDGNQQPAEQPAQQQTQAPQSSNQ